MAQIAERIAALDISLFDDIEAQLDSEDRRSLLAIHAGCRVRYDTFSYLEIGSHLGGSLQSFVRDPACSAIISIDPRPDYQPDERGTVFRYANNSTRRMLSGLQAIPDADAQKVFPIERSTNELSAEDLPVVPELAFIDGEHTDSAALRDARFCLSVMGEHGCILFHDAPVIYRAIGECIRELGESDRVFRPYVMPNSIFVIEVGYPQLLENPQVLERVKDGYKALFDSLERTEPYRAEYRKFAHRVLRRAERLLSDRAGRHRAR